jgi:cytochrome c-type biogenesis protein CcmH/NrfG
MTDSPINKGNNNFFFKLALLVMVAAVTALGYKVYRLADNLEKNRQTVQPEQRNEADTHQADTYQADTHKTDTPQPEPAAHMEPKPFITPEEAQEIIKEHKRREAEEKISKCETEECRKSITKEATAGNTAISTDKARASQLYLEGLKCFNKGDYSKAKEYWTESNQLDPENDAHIGLKRIDSILNTEKSPKDKSQAAKLYLEGLKCFNNKDYLKTKEHWTKAMQLDPENEDVKLGLKRVDQILEFQNK